MTTELATQKTKQRDLLQIMATKYQVDPVKFAACIKETCITKHKDGSPATNEEFMAFVVVANNYNLNPLTREIYAFPGKGGGIVPVVSVDGWISLANRHPQFDGITFDDHIEDGKMVAITAHVWRKDRTQPISVTEYMSECKRNTDTWAQWPNRMLRNKAVIQGSRLAFGFSGIYDPDEAERIIDVEQVVEVAPPAPPVGKTKINKPEPETQGNILE